MKVLYFDTETTGIKAWENEIIQFAAIVEIDGVVKEEVNFRCRPTRTDKVDPGALQTTGLTLEQILAYPDPREMADQIHDLVYKYVNKYDKNDKFYPAGHNVQFDLDFLQAFWKQHVDHFGTGSFQNWRSLDSRVFGNFLACAGKLPCADMKLETLAKHYGVEINAHDALSDIKATREVIRKMLALL